MTAGMTTQTLEGSRVSLPRAGLGALLAATLIAGGLIGAAVSAGIAIAMAQPAAVTLTVPHESNAVRDLRIHAGRGQLVGESGTAVTPIERRLISGDGFDHGVPNGRATDAAPRAYPALTHATGRGPLP